MKIRFAHLIAHLLGVVVFFVLAFPTVAVAVIPITTAVSEGDVVPGIGNVTFIRNFAVNNAGRWMVEADTDHANTSQDGVLLNNDGVQSREDDPVAQPPGARVALLDALNLNSSGNSGWNFLLRGVGPTMDTGMYFNTTLLILESGVSIAPEFTPNTIYNGFFDSKINDSDDVVMMASVDDINIPTTTDRAIVKLDISPAGTLLSESVLAKEGDLLPGQVDAVADFDIGPHGSAMNNQGDVLYVADLDGDVNDDGAIYLNTVLVAQEGGPSPLPGRNYETLLGRAIDLNNSGSYVFKANLLGATTDDDVIIKNNTVVAQKGSSLPDISPFLLEGFGVGPALIDDSGNVVWYGDWNDPNLDRDTGLFVNSELVVQEGVTTVDGLILDIITDAVSAFYLSDNGQWLIFKGFLVGGIDCAILVDLATTMGVAADPVGPTSDRIVELVASPNPFTASTSIRYELAGEGDVRLAVYDLAGRLVARLAEARVGTGGHAVGWDGRGAGGRQVTPGMYFLRLTSGETEATAKLVLAR